MPGAARTLPTAPVRALLLLAAALGIASCSPNQEWISLIGTRGFEPGQFFRPAHLAVDAAGFRYVADTDNHRVQKLTAGGELLATWGRNGDGPGEFAQPRAVAAAPDGSIFVAEWGRRGRTGGEFIFPSGLVVDDRDRVYVADRSNYRVQATGPDGVFVDAIDVGYVGAGKRAIIGPLAWGPGALYAADTFNHVVRMDLEARQGR